MSRSIRDQWEQLIINPLSKLDRNSCPSTILFVIDALDECDSEGDIRIILGVLTTPKLLSNIRLRIFITSRPDTRHGFRKIPEAQREVIVPP
jgi:hypothetical protein